MIRQIHQRLKDWQNRLGKRYGTDISTPAARRAAYWHFQLSDHAFLRVWWTNLYQVAPGVWRSNQPSPERLARHAKDGFKTVINLRGTSKESFWLFEAEACQTHGLALYNVKLNASRPPQQARLLELLQILADAPRPMLIHCKSGADRTGLAAALYLILMHNRSPQEAAAQLSWRYLHFAHTTTGILDHILRLYGRAAAASGIGLTDWVATQYDPEAAAQSFQRWRAGGPEGDW